MSLHVLFGAKCRLRQQGNRALKSSTHTCTHLQLIHKHLYIYLTHKQEIAFRLYADAYSAKLSGVESRSRMRNEPKGVVIAR